MCGIAGVVRLRGRIDERDRTAVVCMLEAEAHRGPDGEGYFGADTVQLGHRRLAIIDLSGAARQPMANETRDVWVVTNGEIYNFRELRGDLEARGHRFASNADTEVIVHGYEEWGLGELLGRLRGMFAFALYDGRRRDRPKLFLARDRFGIKPLYYAHRDERLAFASELTALVAGGIVEAELDPRALTTFLQCGSVPGPATAVRNVEMLEPATYLEVSGGHSETHRYWSLATSAEVASDASVSDLLAESVRLHLVSDVPLGVFSSGGIDSASLVALASASIDRPLTTLSVVLDDAGLDEARYARLVAERYRTDHREVEIRGDDFLETLPEVFDAMDSPTADGVNTYFVSRAAKQAGLTVVLSGLGGDEVFLGYPQFKRVARWSSWYRVWAEAPQPVRTMVVAAGKTLLGKDKLDYLHSPSASNLYWMFRGVFSPGQIARLLQRNVDGELVSVSPQSSDESVLDAIVRLELDHYLHDQLLRDTDVMSMAHSVEARVPFLDHRLVEAVFSIPHTSKLSRNVNKPLLLDALPEPLPREVWDRPKQGFTLPFRRWMIDHDAELRSRTHEPHLFDRAAVDACWDAFVAGRLHWSRPWALVAFGAWYARLRKAGARARKSLPAPSEDDASRVTSTVASSALQR